MTMEKTEHTRSYGASRSSTWRQMTTEIARHHLQIDGFASCIGQQEVPRTDAWVAYCPSNRIGHRSRLEHPPQQDVIGYAVATPIAIRHQQIGTEPQAIRVQTALGKH